MKHLLKFGGLAFSGALTVLLFTDLFGVGAFGVLAAGAALVLFEVGAIAWARLLLTAEGQQRTVASTCLSLTVALSLLSSCAEIVLFTKLGAEAFKALDLEFLTLCMVACALAVNVVGVLAFDYFEPSTLERHKTLERESRERAAAVRLEDSISALAIRRTENKVGVIAGNVADGIADTMRDSIVGRVAHKRLSSPSSPTQISEMPVNPAVTFAAESESAPTIGGAEFGDLSDTGKQQASAFQPIPKGRTRKAR